MTKKYFSFIILILLILGISLSGCSVSFTKNKMSELGGVFKSINHGKTWEHKVLIKSVLTKKQTIGNTDITNIVIDPQDNQTIYLGTEKNGIYYSNDGANSWEHSKGLDNMTIDALAIDPKSRNIIYASSGNSIFKSTDCANNFKRIYYDTKLTIKILSLAVDHYNTAIIYAGTSRGDILKSLNYGKNWTAIYRVPDQIKKIIISPNDSRIIYFATKKSGIYKTTNSGKSWVSYKKDLKKYKDGLIYKDMVCFNDIKDGLILANNYGLLRTKDGGKTWEKINLNTPKKGANIYSLAVNPKNHKEIYYGTDTTFYHSIDGGISWSSKKLPSNRVANVLSIDYEHPNIIYLGVLKQKKSNLLIMNN